LPTEPPGLLISRPVHDRIGAQLSALARAASQALRLVISDPDQPPCAPDRASIRLAYYSHDMLRGGSKTAPSPATRAFFDVLDDAPHAEWLHVCSAGTDNPFYQPTLRRPMRLTTSSGATAKPIAQTVVGAILCQSRGFTHWLGGQAERCWRPLAAPQLTCDLHEQTAVIVGMGPIGRETGRLLKAVGLTTIGVRRRVAAADGFDRVCAPDMLDELLPHCHWLVLACPLTPQTRNLLDARRIALLPAHAGVVNIGRGELLDENALAAALHARRLRSAYLDVFATEPLPEDSALWHAPHTWISPHNAGASPGTAARADDIFLRNFMHWLGAEPFENDATPAGAFPAPHTARPGETL